MQLGVVAHLVVEQAYGGDRTPGTRRLSMHDAIRLTQAEATEPADDLVVRSRRWSERTRGRDDARRTYLLHTMLLPYPDVATPQVDD